MYWLLGAAAMAAGLFAVGEHVKQRQKDLIELDRTLTKELERIHVLQAELATLTRPEALEAWNARHLDLIPLKAEQIRDLRFLPAKDPAASGPSPIRARAGRGDPVTPLATAASPRPPISVSLQGTPQ